MFANERQAVTRNLILSSGNNHLMRFPSRKFLKYGGFRDLSFCMAVMNSGPQQASPVDAEPESDSAPAKEEIANDASADAAVSEPKKAQRTESVGAKACEEKSQVVSEEIVNDPLAETEPAPDADYIHPRQALKPVKMPSEQKLKELIACNKTVWRYLMDKINFLTATHETAIIKWSLSDRFTKEMCINSLRLLENKGYIAAYEYGGEVWYCAAPASVCPLKKGEFEQADSAHSEYQKNRKTGF